MDGLQSSSKRKEGEVNTINIYPVGQICVDIEDLLDLVVIEDTLKERSGREYLPFDLNIGIV